MGEEKKDNCCSTGSSSCCCCKGGKKFIFGAIIGILLFVSGMIFAKSCPLSGSMCSMGKKMCHVGADGQKICPITGKPMGEMPAK